MATWNIKNVVKVGAIGFVLGAPMGLFIEWPAILYPALVIGGLWGIVSARFWPTRIEP